MTVKVPDTLAATLAPDVLAALEAKLAPPPELRAKARVEFEIEAAGEGTFTLLIENGKLSAKKGFAKDPLVGATVPKGGWPLLQRELQAVVDDLPQAPNLRAKLEAARHPKAGDLDAVIAALKKLVDARVDFTVKSAAGSHKYSLARGAVDEATRILTIAIDSADIDSVLAGAPPTHLRATIGGDRGLLTAAAAALAPVLNLLRA